jgi:hypothetical protein
MINFSMQNIRFHLVSHENLLILRKRNQSELVKQMIGSILPNFLTVMPGAPGAEKQTQPCHSTLQAGANLPAAG